MQQKRIVKYDITNRGLWEPTLEAVENLGCICNFLKIHFIHVEIFTEGGYDFKVMGRLFQILDTVTEKAFAQVKLSTGNKRWCGINVRTCSRIILNMTI